MRNKIFAKINSFNFMSLSVLNKILKCLKFFVAPRELASLISLICVNSHV